MVTLHYPMINQVFLGSICRSQHLISIFQMFRLSFCHQKLRNDVYYRSCRLCRCVFSLLKGNHMGSNYPVIYQFSNLSFSTYLTVHTRVHTNSIGNRTLSSIYLLFILFIDSVVSVIGDLLVCGKTFVL